jgi:putative DNA primase/helicase
VNRVLDAALGYAARGWSVLILGAGQKTPATKHGCLDATTDPDVIRQWWAEMPDANVGIATGSRSGLVVLDVDVKDGKPGRESCAELKLPPTVISQTPTGGWHCFFQSQGREVRNRTGIRPGLDVRGENGYVVAAPSQVSGKYYQWQLDPDDTDIAPLPDSLVALLDSPTLVPAPAAGGIAQGGRNDYLARMGGMLRGQGMSQAGIEAVLLAENREQCRPPLPEDEVRKVAASMGRYPAPEATTDHPAPTPLPDGLPPVAPYSPDLLPPVLADWVADVAERMQCPADFPAVAVVVLCAGLIGRQVSIRPKARDNWVVVPNLWGAVIARPGLMKTPAVREALRPLYALENFERDQHRDAEAAYQHEATEAKNRRRVAEEQHRKALRDDPGARLDTVPEPESPTRRRYIVADATVEKLGELLNENANGLLMVRDELSGFLRGLDRHGREADRAFYLECWNGDGSFTYDRIGRGTIDIESCCLSIIGTIQPGPFQAYLRAGRENGAADDGLLQRFQLAVWPDDPGAFRDVDRAPDCRAQEAMRAAIDKLEKCPTSALTKLPEGASVSFDSTALRRFQDWRGELENRLRGDEHPAIESHLAKYRSLVPSLALVLHLVERGPEPLVNNATLERAIRWAVYLETHARRIYAPLVGGDMDAARLLARRLQRGELGSRFAARDVYRNGWAGLSSPDTVKAALQVLEDYDWIFTSNVQTPGRTRLEYVVNSHIRPGGVPT